jgi:hypothetical protein
MQMIFLTVSYCASICFLIPAAAGFLLLPAAEIVLLYHYQYSAVPDSVLFSLFQILFSSAQVLPLPDPAGLWMSSVFEPIFICRDPAASCESFSFCELLLDFFFTIRNFLCIVCNLLLRICNLCIIFILCNFIIGKPSSYFFWASATTTS